MATMLDGESYLGRVMIRPLSKTTKVSLFLWPLRCLKSGMGGPTFGVDVNGEEIIRYDAHGPRGHWHKNGYDKLGAGGSHVEFPENLREDMDGQIAWSLDQLQSQTRALLTEAGHPNAAAALEDAMLTAAVQDIQTHLAKEGNLRPLAIAKGVLKS